MIRRNQLTPPVSVVIPAHNEQIYIADAIRSVQSQTCDVLEVIVVDDGSTDETALVARRLGARVIRQDNRGVSAARNTGIRAAVGTWTAFLDADDIWEPEKIEMQWKLSQRCSKAGVISCDLSLFTEEGIVESSYFSALGENYTKIKKLHGNNDNFKIEKLEDAFFEANWILFPSTLMVRRDVIQSVELFDERLRAVEDYEFIMRVLARYHLAVVGHPLVRYRVHEGNSHNDQVLMHDSVVQYIELLSSRPHLYPPSAVRAANNEIIATSERYTTNTFYVK
jgi:glycosyltransferase involved in cell wall biosynthesis